MIRNIVFGLLSLAIPAAIIAFLTITNAPKYRMSYLPCPAELIHSTFGDTDYLISGSSRTLLAVGAQRLSDGFDGSGLEKPVVVSLGRSWKGNGQIYHMFRDYMETHDVKKAILMELSYVSYTDSRSQAYYNGYYPNYPLVTHTSDFSEDIRAARREPFYIGWHNYLNLIEKQLKQRFSQLYSKRAVVDLPEASPLEGSRDCLVRENRLKPHILDRTDNMIERRFKSDWKNRPLRIGNPKVINNDRPTYYIKKLKELAQANDIEFYLFMVPQYKGGFPQYDRIKAAEDYYGVNILVPDEKTLERLNVRENYADNSHMTKKGREVFSDWLASELKNSLEK